MGRNAGPVALVARLFLSGWRGVLKMRRVLIPTVVVAAAVAPVFWRHCRAGDLTSDHEVHVGYIRARKMPTYPLYHLSVDGLGKCLEIYASAAQAPGSWLPFQRHAETLANMAE